MRTAILSVNIGLLFLLCICLFHSGKVSAEELCPVENCMSPNKCNIMVKSQSVFCARQGDICCSVVEHEFRTHCRHHGGACMTQCGQRLQRDVVDCEDGQVCCVLV